MKTMIFRGRKLLVSFALAGGLLTLGLQNPCFAQADPDTSKPDIKATVTVANQPSSPEEMQQKLVEMQDRMAVMQQDYDRRLREMQSTIQTLTVQISKSGTAPAEAARPVPPGDQDIGEELIFGSDDIQATQPARPLTPTSTGADLLTGISGSSLGGGFTQGNINRQLQNFNPDITVTGDFIGHFGNQKLEGENRIRARELEFGFVAPIDPYATATFIFAKPDDEELEVEEAYVTLLDLPWDLQAKVGKMFSPFGKLNVVHTHDLPQTDRPNVLTHFFGEEGLRETGVAISKILPTPWFSSIDLQLGNGETGPFFTRNSLVRPTVVGRWRNVFEFSDTKFLEVGVSGAFGHRLNANDETLTPDRLVRASGVQGIDITYKWIPPRPDRGFTWQTELLAAQMEAPGTGERHLFGGYSFMEYRFHQRWSAGVRFDFTEVPLLENATELAITPYINFWQSEFGRFRLEYKHTYGTNVPQHDQVWLQYTVLMGPHPAHTF